MAKVNIDLVVGRKERERNIRDEVRKASGNSDGTIQTPVDKEQANLAKGDWGKVTDVTLKKKLLQINSPEIKIIH